MSSPKKFTDSIGKSYQLAPFTWRVSAFVIDSIVISLIGLFATKFLEANLYRCFVGVTEASEAHLHYNIVKRIITDEFYMFFIIGLPYHVVTEQSSLQGSIGKRILGMIVTDKDADKPSFLQSLLRNFFKFSILVLIPVLIWRFIHVFPPLVFIIWVIILIMAANDKYTRFLSDFPTKSFVLQRKR